MWVCLPSGMYMPALRPANKVPPGDDRLLQIRSRRIVDLQRLKARYLPELGDIIQLPHTDYEYRAYCTHRQWAEALYGAAMDIDYVKFKEQAEVQYGDVELHNVYTAMWYTVFTKMSTKVHQAAYWGRGVVSRGRGRGGNGRHRQAGTTRWDEQLWASEEASRTFGDDHVDDRTLASLVPAEWDDQVPKVTRFPNSGNIDHSHCTHANSKAAKRRCSQRNQDK